MIHTLVYAQQREQANITPFGSGTPKYVNSWLAIRKCLEGTGDHIIWTVTDTQMPGFLTWVKKYGLDKYLVVDHSGNNDGTTNRNYPEKLRRLRVFIMKGAK